MAVAHLWRIIQRWLGLILSLVLVTSLAVTFHLMTAEPVYEGQVKVQLTAPQPEDVELFDRYRSSSIRDEITVARNNFSEVLQSREVYKRTIRRLGLSGKDAAYDVEVRPMRDSDFIYVTAQARTPGLAAEIANAHLSAAIEYLGEMRAKPAAAARDLLADQVRVAADRLRSAQETLAKFQTENGVGSLETTLASYQTLLQQLQMDRNRRLIEGPTSREIEAQEKLLEELKLERERAIAQDDKTKVANLDEAIARYTAQLESLRKATNPTADIDSLIAQRQAELDRLLALTPKYKVLEENVKQAREEYQLLLNKYTEALLKAESARTANYIQVVEPAIAPTQPAPRKLSVLLGLAMVGSLGVGIGLAFLLEYLTGPRAAKAPASARASISHKSIVSISDQAQS